MVESCRFIVLHSSRVFLFTQERPTKKQVRMDEGVWKDGMDEQRLLTSSCCFSLPSCLTLCDPMDCSPSGSSVHGISQARILEWVAVPSSRDLPHPGIEPASPASNALKADSLPTELSGKPWLKCLSAIDIFFKFESLNLSHLFLSSPSLLSSVNHLFVLCFCNCFSFVTYAH